MKLLLMVLLLAQTQIQSYVPGHPITIQQGQIQINLHGLSAGADWIFGAKASNIVSVAVAHMRHAPTQYGLRMMQSMTPWEATNLRIRNGVVDIDRLGAMTEGSLIVYLNIPADTTVIVQGDAPTPIFTGRVHDSVMVRQGNILSGPLNAPATLIATVLRPERRGAVPAVQQLANGKFIGSMEALKQRTKTITKPTATSDGTVMARVTIDAAGRVATIDFTSGPAALQTALSQVTQTWAFTPFAQGEVIVPIIVVFHNGTAQSPLWD